MPLLDTKKQVAAKLEDVTGVAETLTASEVDILPIEAQMTPEFDTFDREFVRSTLSRLLGVTTEELGAFTLTTELRGTQGGAFGDGAPSWFKYAQACGMQQSVIDVLALDITSPLNTITGGPFRHGEIVELDASPGAVYGTVVHDWHNGAGNIYLRDVVGTFPASGTITGRDTGATATARTGTPLTANYGYALFPVDDPEKTLNLSSPFTTAATAGDVIEGAESGALAVLISNTTGTMTFRPLEGAFSNGENLLNKSQGGIDTGANAATPTSETYTKGHSMTIRLLEDGYYSEIAGARGNMRIVLPQVNRPGRVEFAFSGFWNDQGDQVLFTGTSPNLKQPPLFRNTAVYLGDNLSTTDQADEYNPCLASLELDLGNQLVNRECQGALKGIQEVLISERQGAGRMDPELTLAAVQDWVGLLSAGTPVRLRTTIGSSNGNKFFVTAPGLQYESAAPGERNKIVQRDIGFKLTSGNLNNLVTSPPVLSSIGGANELVISYIAP